MNGYVLAAIIGGMLAVNALVRRQGAAPMMTRQQSTARVRQLRAQGYKVKLVRLDDGSTAVVRSKRPVV